MYNYTLMFLKLLYRITIISATLSILNNNDIFNNKFIFNIITTSIVFLITQMINDSLKEQYDKIKIKLGYDIMPIIISPIIISILYTLRHCCTNFYFICKK